MAEDCHCRTILFSANILRDGELLPGGAETKVECTVLTKPLHPRSLIAEVERLIGKPIALSLDKSCPLSNEPLA
jgi:hypothetical protein